MSTESLSQVIARLKSSPLISGIFLTGSTTTGISTSSDIDLVIITKKGANEVRSIYTEIEKHFADIFFFDVDFIERLQSAKEVSANDFQGMFTTWLGQGRIEYDPLNILHQLQDRVTQHGITQTISETEKLDAWVKVNYSLIANKRYFASEQSVYHQALEVRLLYSVTELLTTYFVLRDQPWRGEKKAVEYLARQDREYWGAFEGFLRSTDLPSKMKSYLELFQRTLNNQYPEWNQDFIIPVDTHGHYKKSLETVWSNLLEKEKSE